MLKYCLARPPYFGVVLYIKSYILKFLQFFIFVIN